MQFKVPQFIDVEDKLFGPLSFKQFVYLAGGGLGSFAIYKLLPIWIGIFLIIPLVALSLALTFYKINNQPFIYYLEAGINYLLSNKLYIWKQRLIKHDDKTTEDVSSLPKKTSIIPMESGNKLTDIAWNLDIEKGEDTKKDKILSGEKELIVKKEKEPKESVESSK